MSFFFPNIDGCEALLSARQPERKTSSNSKDSTKKLNLVLCRSWSCETMVWWICTKRMNWFCKKILSKWTMQYTNETFHTHTHLSFSVLLIEFLPTLDSWDIGGLWETLNDFERLRYGVSLAQKLERGGSIRERTLTKKTLRERVLRERDGIAGEGPTRAIKTHPELWAQLEKIDSEQPRLSQTSLHMVTLHIWAVYIILWPLLQWLRTRTLSSIKFNLCLDTSHAKCLLIYWLKLQLRFGSELLMRLVFGAGKLWEVSQPKQGSNVATTKSFKTFCFL